MDLSKGVAQSSKMGLRMVMTILPILGLVFAFFWFKKKYILTDSKVEEIAGELEQKHQA
jgi:melibiose permease